MMSDIEDQIRISLRDELRNIDQRSLKKPVLPPPARRSQRGMIIAAAAAVIAVTMAASLAVVAHRQTQDAMTGAPPTVAASTPALTATTAEAPAAVVTSDAITVQGAVIPVPRGWHGQNLTNESSTTVDYQLCMLPNARKLDPKGCLRSEGIFIRLAQVMPGDTAGTLSGTLSGTFQTACGDAEISPSLESSLVGAKPGNKITVTCIPRSAPTHATQTPVPKSKTQTTVYWELSDQTLTVQTPFDGTSVDIAERMVQQINLSHWLHTPTRESASTAGSPAPPMSR